MSTDMQQYSIANQSEVIACYAAQRGLTIVRSYQDEGKSGLRLDGRDALRELLNDVTSGQADFKTVLVYDISRWGRFQDCDESAYYEFTCREAGVAIEYCAEQFENDGSPMAAIMKNIKRAMAGELSRELSVKSFQGHCRMAAMGFHRGSTAGYGLRRALIDAQRQPRAILSFGQRKIINTDRIILIPGPDDEVANINRIYRMFVDENRTAVEIAQCLNEEGLVNDFGRVWRPQLIRQILTNEKYIGNNVYGRTSKKLGGKWRRNPRAQWVRADSAFRPIVTKELFDRAQFRIKHVEGGYTASELLNALSAIWCRYGKLSTDVMGASGVAPSPFAYCRRFGSLMRAYELVGYRSANPGRRLVHFETRRSLCRQICDGISRNGGKAYMTSRNLFIRANEELSILVTIAKRARHGSRTRWWFGYVTNEKPDILLVVRLDPDSGVVRDYFILPFLLTSRRCFTFYDDRLNELEAFRTPAIEPLYHWCGRETLRRSVTERRSTACRDWLLVDRYGEDIQYQLATIEKRLSLLLDKCRNLISDSEFQEALRAEGFVRLPRPLTFRSDDVPLVIERLPISNYGRTVMDFVIISKFFFRVASNARIEQRLSRQWPSLVNEMRAAYSWLSTSELFRRTRPVANCKRVISKEAGDPVSS